MATHTDAIGPALGYMYQSLYALLLLLKAGDDSQIYIEKLDDIKIESAGDAIEALQVKHSIQQQPSNLSNKSREFWKSLGNWSDKLNDGELDSVTRLTLITVSSTSKGSIMEELEELPTKRQNNVITDKLMEIVDEILQLPSPSSHHLYNHVTSFQALSPGQRLSLIDCIQIVAKQENAASIDEKIKSELQIHPQFRDAYYMQVMGWWSDRVRLHLTNQTRPISKTELQINLHDIREGYTRENLPLSYSDAEPPAALIEQQGSLRFVQQLTLIGMVETIVEDAIRDYYRAFSERQKWLDEQVIQWDQLRKYERELTETWRYYCEGLKVDLEILDTDEDSKIRFGKKLYFDLMKHDIPPIRSLVTASYIKRGSFQILADYAKPRVWWHPDFVKHLQETIQFPVLDGDELTIFDVLGDDSTIASDTKNLSQAHSVEESNLLNPAFGAVLLYEAIRGYTEQINVAGMPYGFLYLIFPLVLNVNIRNSLPRTYQGKLLSWTLNNPHHLPYIQGTFDDLKQAANNALIFAMNQNVIDKGEGATFAITPQKRLAAKKYAGEFETEVDDIRKASRKLGRIFSLINVDVKVIYGWLGAELS